VVVFQAVTALSIDASQKKRLEQLLGSHKTRKKIRLRARIVLRASEGLANHAIARQLGTSRPTVLLWRGRFKQFGVPGLIRDRQRPGRKRTLSGEKIKAVVQATLQATPVDATHWSVRSMAKAQGLSRMAVQRIWTAHKLRAHRVGSLELSQDPKFVKKVREVVGLYLNPPDKALVFAVAEKNPVPPLHRTGSLAVRQGILCRQSQDHEHRGLSLFAALGLLDGKIIGEGTPRHRRLEFIGFLDKIDQETPDELDLHLIVDNESAHKSPLVKRWLKGHGRFHLHFMPNRSSRLSLLEFWFGKTTRERIRRRTFKSVKELTEAIETYLRAPNQNPKRFVWTKAAEPFPGWRTI